MKRKNSELCFYFVLFISYMLTIGCENKQANSNHVQHHAEFINVNLTTEMMPANSTVLSSISTITAHYMQMPIVINAQGYLDYDTRTYNNISARYSGRIEKLYVKYAYQMIHRGQHLLDIYSPEVITAQQDLIFLIEHSKNETSLINSAKQRLNFLGLSATQIKQLIKTKKPYYYLPIFSPFSGHVHSGTLSSSYNINEMNNDQGYTSNTALTIKEGIYVQKGETLFNVVDPYKLWAVLKIQNNSLAQLKTHQKVRLTLPDFVGKVILGRVDFIEPELENGDKTISIRVYINNNDHKLMANSLVKASINAGLIKGLWIPEAALLNLGQHKIVWLKKGALFKTREIKAISFGKNELITNGLSTNDTIAAEAHYLIDSESFIQLKRHEK